MRNVGLAILTVLLAQCPSAFSQSNPEETKKWELSVVGGVGGHNGTEGFSALPPRGNNYTVFVRPALWNSRSVPSWFFGDGAVLFNEAADRVGSVPHITPLDPVLTSSAVEPSRASLGFRLSRQIKRWAAAEISLERSGGLRLSDRAVNGIHASQNSYAPAFRAVTAGGFTDAQSVIKTHGGFMTLSTIDLVLKFKYRRLEPFVVVGAGAQHDGGSTPTATLTGTYDPGPRAGANSDPILDTVHLDFAPSHRWSYVSVVGGGIKIPIKWHFGIAVEGRTYVYDNPITTSLSANHTTPQIAAFVVNATAGSFALAEFLSIIPPGTLVGGPPQPAGPFSSLSAPPISGFQAFTANGRQARVVFSVGPFWRF